MSLNYTPLRHKMLAKIKAGQVCRGLGTNGWWIMGVLPSTYGMCERAIDSMAGQLAVLPAAARHDTPLELTEAGALILATWNGAHGEPT